MDTPTQASADANKNNNDTLLAHLAPVMELLRTQDLLLPHRARAALQQQFAVTSPWFLTAKALVRRGVAEGWLCDRQNAGVKFSRVKKAHAADDFSVDAVHMSGGGAPHTHPLGEVSIAFAVSGAPRFDGHAEGFAIYAPRSWHVPTVTGGVMDIVYFLPGGAVQFTELGRGTVIASAQAVVASNERSQ